MDWTEYDTSSNSYFVGIPGELSSKNNAMKWVPLVPLSGETRSEPEEIILQINLLAEGGRAVNFSKVQFVVEENKTLNLVRLLRKVSVSTSVETTEIRVKFTVEEVKSINNKVYRDIIRTAKEKNQK